MEITGLIGAIILAHLIGDYVLQSDYMAQKKTSQWIPAILHGIFYTLPFLFITQSPLALFVIAATHIIIDRFRLAKYLVWAKNQLAPKSHRYPWNPNRKARKPKRIIPPVPVDYGKGVKADKIQTVTTDFSHITRGPIDGSVLTTQNDSFVVRNTEEDNNPNTGYKNSSPPFMAVWLMIILDNTLHLTINLGAVYWL